MRWRLALPVFAGYRPRTPPARPANSRSADRRRSPTRLVQGAVASSGSELDVARGVSLRFDIRVVGPQAAGRHDIDAPADHDDRIHLTSVADPSGMATDVDLLPRPVGTPTIANPNRHALPDWVGAGTLAATQSSSDIPRGNVVDTMLSPPRRSKRSATPRLDQDSPGFQAVLAGQTPGSTAHRGRSHRASTCRSFAARTARPMALRSTPPDGRPWTPRTSRVLTRSSFGVAKTSGDLAEITYARPPATTTTSMNLQLSRSLAGRPSMTRGTHASTTGSPMAPRHRRNEVPCCRRGKWTATQASRSAVAAIGMETTHRRLMSLRRRRPSSRARTARGTASTGRASPSPSPAPPSMPFGILAS